MKLLHCTDRLTLDTQCWWHWIIVLRFPLRPYISPYYCLFCWGVESRCKNTDDNKKLLLDDEKTEAVISGTKASHLKVSVNSVHIQQSVIPLSNTVRVLGLFLDKNLTVTNNISSVITLKVPERKNCKCSCRITCHVMVWLLQKIICRAYLKSSHWDYSESKTLP